MVPPLHSSSTLAQVCYKHDANDDSAPVDASGSDSPAIDAPGTEASHALPHLPMLPPVPSPPCALSPVSPTLQRLEILLPIFGPAVIPPVSQPFSGPQALFFVTLVTGFAVAPAVRDPPGAGVAPVGHETPPPSPRILWAPVVHVSILSIRFDF